MKDWEFCGDDRIEEKMVGGAHPTGGRRDERVSCRRENKRWI
jgi:hypothetical protein